MTPDSAAVDGGARSGRELPPSDVVGDAPPPLQGGRRNPFRHLLRDVVYHLGARPGIALLSRLPLPAARRTGRMLGSLAYHILPGEARRARANLARAFPERPQRELDAIAHASFKSLGRVFAEWVRSSRMSVEEFKALLPFEGLDYLENARARGRGVLLMSGHFDCWEWAGAAVGVRVPRYAAVAKPVYDPRLDDLLRAWRKRFGEDTIMVHETRKVVRMLKGGDVVAVLPDQSVRGIAHAMVPWFGHDAPTPVGAVRVAAATGAVIMTGFLKPRGDGLAMVLEPLADDAREGQEIEIMTRFHQRLEGLVRANPDRWVWLHDRWRIRPGTVMRGD